jgi:hypothetical protein
MSVSDSRVRALELVVFAARRKALRAALSDFAVVNA